MDPALPGPYGVERADSSNQLFPPSRRMATSPSRAVRGCHRRRTSEFAYPSRPGQRHPRLSRPRSSCPRSVFGRRSGRVPRESLDAPKNLPEQARRQVALGAAGMDKRKGHPKFAAASGWGALAVRPQCGLSIQLEAGRRATEFSDHTASSTPPAARSDDGGRRPGAPRRSDPRATPQDRPPQLAPFLLRSAGEPQTFRVRSLRAPDNL